VQLRYQFGAELTPVVGRPVELLMNSVVTPAACAWARIEASEPPLDWLRIPDPHALASKAVPLAAVAVGVRDGVTFGGAGRVQAHGC